MSQQSNGLSVNTNQDYDEREKEYDKRILDLQDKYVFNNSVSEYPNQFIPTREPELIFSKIRVRASDILFIKLQGI